MSFKVDDITHDLTVEELLFLILEELKIMNTYNALGHDAELTIEDTQK